MKIIKSITKEEYDKINPWGMTLSLDLDECDYYQITESELMKDFIKKLCDEIEMIQHGEPIIDNFAEGDLEEHSLMQFIETSSITAHFDDKKGHRAFIDIFSCQWFDTEKATAFCKKHLTAKTVEMSIMLRGNTPA